VFFPFLSITPAHHSTLPIPLTDGVAWLQLGLMGGVILLMVWLVQRAPVVGWLLVAAVVSLLPVLNIRPLEMAKGLYTAERFLTFPLALFVLATVVALASGRVAVRKWAAVGATAWVLFGSHRGDSAQPAELAREPYALGMDRACLAPIAYWALEPRRYLQQNG
jgi:hypothetical protein